MASSSRTQDVSPGRPGASARDWGAWHTLDAADVASRLGVDPAAGLSEGEAARRLAADGPNELSGSDRRSPWSILRDQFTSLMMAVLAAAAAVSLAVGEIRDAVAILAILALNAALGFRQEYRAERAMAALASLAAPVARVRRGGAEGRLSSRLLVPGDVVLLEAGQAVPADGRLLAAFGLRTQESALTGESAPVDKETGPLPEEGVALGDRRNMVYLGTLVAAGRGEALVTATGMKTQLGTVAGLVRSVVRDPTPLQRRMAKVARVLAGAAVVLVGLVAVLGLLRGEDPRSLFLVAVSMAVAAVPEGLPAVVTIALALGAERMLRRKALIRRLPAVETLGSVTVICADKTGTLTGNRMAVVLLEAAGRRLDLRAGPAEPSGPAVTGPLALLAAGGALCGDARLLRGAAGEEGLRADGEPTEAALVVAAARLGLPKDGLEEALPRVAEAPFDSGRRRMTTVHGPIVLPAVPGRPAGAGPGSWADSLRGRYVAFTKGAVDGLLPLSSRVEEAGGPAPLSPARRAAIAAAADGMAREGLRVLGVAYRPLDDLPPGGSPGLLERDLVFVGMAGMIDPPRPESAGAVRTCRAAGIRPVMITGDHPATAARVAGEIGIDPAGGVLTGREIETLGDRELAAAAEGTSVYARVAPEHKLRIVGALKSLGHVVAMTGDGVNDAPALRKADIGVAMGLAGTDVAKEAADMVLQDDNFATIVAAVEEGRAIDDNIRKFLRYILASNVGEILVMLAAPFLGMPLPLLPLQILWVNLVTDGLPALALAVEPAGRDVMRRPPRAPRAPLFSREMNAGILLGGAVIGALSLLSGWGSWTGGSPAWRTMVFTTLTFAQMANVLAIRSGPELLLRVGLLSNRPLAGAVVLTVAAHLAILYIPALGGIFRTVPLSGGELALCAALAAVFFLGLEGSKIMGSRRRG